MGSGPADGEPRQPDSLSEEDSGKYTVIEKSERTTFTRIYLVAQTVDCTLVGGLLYGFRGAEAEMGVGIASYKVKCQFIAAGFINKPNSLCVTFGFIAL